MEDLKSSLQQYNEQLEITKQALVAAQDESERVSLLTLQSDLLELIQLTQESLDAVGTSTVEEGPSNQNDAKKDDETELDDEYALFMQEMAKSGAYDEEKPQCSKDATHEDNPDSDIEDELATLLGMKCAVYHTHKWGGQPSLHNAMVSAVVPRQDEDQFKDLQVRVLFTHPTHSEMLPCPFFLDGECKFSDEQCRYSHGAVVPLSDLKEAIEPDFGSIKIGSRILLKLKPVDGEDVSLTKKSTEKYHLWHRAVVTHINIDKRVCVAKLECSNTKPGEKRKSSSDEYHVKFEEIFPLNCEDDSDSDSEGSISDTEYPESKAMRPEAVDAARDLLVEKSFQYNGPAMGEWERHTRGIGSKLMLAMGYVPGTGLGSTGEGRVQPVEARVLPVGKSLDHCLAISEKAAGQDPLKVEQKLRRLQKKEEERNKRAYEREKEKERSNVFNFLNRTLGDTANTNLEDTTGQSIDIKQSSSKDLNIEKFKIEEDSRKIEREIVKLNSSLARHPSGSGGHTNITLQIMERQKDLDILRNKEKSISKEQMQRKNKQKMTVF